MLDSSQILTVSFELYETILRGKEKEKKSSKVVCNSLAHLLMIDSTQYFILFLKFLYSFSTTLILKGG